MIFTGSFDVLKVRRGRLEVTMTTTGPNDAFRVVWAFGKLFYFFIRVFFLLNDVYRFFCCFKSTEGSIGG